MVGPCSSVKIRRSATGSRWRSGARRFGEVMTLGVKPPGGIRVAKVEICRYNTGKQSDTKVISLLQKPSQ